MRIYDGDFTVNRLIEQCGTVPRRVSNLPVPGREPPKEIDIVSLNRCLSDLPVAEIRRRRQRMNTFYEEVLVSSDADRGIQFTSLLMILAHHKVINDNKSLRYVSCRRLSDQHADTGIDLKSSSADALVFNVSKKLCAAMSSWVSSIHCTGPAVSDARWNKRSKAAWRPFHNSLYQRFSSTTKTSPTRSARLIIRPAGARSSRPPTRTHKAGLLR